MLSSYDENSQALHALGQGTALEGPLVFSVLLRKLDGDTRHRFETSRADPTFDTPAPIDILFGADLFAQTMTGEQYILRKDLPIAFGTVFGVVLKGPTPCSTVSVPQDHFNGITTLLSINYIDLRSSLQNFWKLEELSHSKVLSKEKQLCDMEILAYFFAPLGLLLLINLFLFAATAWELTCGLWKTEVVKASTERAALGRVCVKLVIMMGLTWVLDIISWAVGGPSYLWYLPDLLNTLQGVFIFIVVGCHPQVWAAVKRNCLGERTNRTLARHQLSSVSQASRSALDTTNTTKIIPLETMC
uniref:Uncharacterized protein n=1 Tax=Timema douglasi TaxID=61478 RepID=A0A7R8VTM4_TIMDO|nr:unnamed protein product [Timema douglasi]